MARSFKNYSGRLCIICICVALIACACDDESSSSSQIGDSDTADSSTSTDDTGTDTNTNTDTNTSTNTDTNTDTNTGTNIDTSTGTNTDTNIDTDIDSGNCIKCSFSGSSDIIIGGSFEDASVNSAPFDARYRYLAGGIPRDIDCAAACSTACASWWGCWQDYAQPAGQYILNFIKNAESATYQGAARPLIPVITYYQQLHTSHLGEGTAQVESLNFVEDLTLYLNDWRFLLQTVGNHVAWLHIEPDLWGYVRFVNENPHLVPAKVKAANPTDCADEEDSAAGVASCMIKMVRKYAPNAKVGLHASAWLIKVQGDDVAAGNFMKDLGANKGDFIVFDLADRDAGYYEVVQGQDRWMDDAAIRNMLSWAKQVSEINCTPIVLWQLPLGNMSLDNTDSHYKDNRLDWLFDNTTEVAAAHVIAMLFGAGADGCTVPETDGGHFFERTIAYQAAGGVPMCP